MTGPAFLAGAVIDGWYAKSLRGGDKDGLGQWSEADIVTFLRTGSTDALPLLSATWPRWWSTARDI